MQKLGPGHGRLLSLRASLNPNEEGGEEKKKTDKKKKTISKKIPEHMPARRTTDGDSEASAIDVETPGHIEDQGAEKNDQKKITDQNRSRQPDSHDQTQAYQQLDPGQKEGDEVDQHVGKNLIIVNDVRKRNGVDDFVVTGEDKDPSQEQTR